MDYLPSCLQQGVAQQSDMSRADDSSTRGYCTAT